MREWLEQLELVARWDNQAKLVNLVTQLKGEAYSFFMSCLGEQRGSSVCCRTAAGDQG